MNNIIGNMPYDNINRAEKQIITIPYKFTPRVYQRELLAAMDSGYKRALLVYHRRAG